MRRIEYTKRIGGGATGREAAPTHPPTHPPTRVSPFGSVSIVFVSTLVIVSIAPGGEGAVEYGCVVAMSRHEVPSLTHP